jgi:hypothetical protein
MNVTTFTKSYPPKIPAKRSDVPDESRLLEADDGMGTLPSYVLAAETVTWPGQSLEQKDGKHLWVILPEEVRLILEVAPQVRPPPLTLGVAKHSNLTGGAPACCGGELWVDAVDRKKVYANGGSGRYPAKDPQHLEDAMRVLAFFGFEVISAGWSIENDCPERIFR